MDTGKILDWREKQKVEYCIPMWLRDQQIAAAIARPIPRIEPVHELRDDPIALACYGPSLQDTWEQIRGFRWVMSCSGAHKFLVERGIVPTWHVEVDPRAHKIDLVGRPTSETEYLISSTCHPSYFDHLIGGGGHVRLWHVFDSADDAHRTLPHGEWALTGGCSVGLRTMTIARFLGFRSQHIFGMDGCAKESASHAAGHPKAITKYATCEYEGKTYRTTPSMLETARQTFHELNQMPDVEATFYGDGLVQAMAKGYVREPMGFGKEAILGIVKPEVISTTYRDLNRQMHDENPAFGVGGDKHAPTVLKLAEAIKTKNILDYGAGKRRLGRAIPWQIAEYDPAVPEIAMSPKPADLVVCTDVLEHIEPDKLTAVLEDIKRVTLQVGYLVIHTGPSTKLLPDGRNAHLIQQGREWWEAKLGRGFTIAKVIEKPPLVTILVGPKR